MIIPNAFGRPYCVYMHVCDGEVVYVGSGSLSRAVAGDGGHRSKEWEEFARVNVINVVIVSWFDKRATAFKMERSLIHVLRPRLNKMMRAIHPPRIPKIRQLKRVRCVETGVEYVSAKAASQELNVNAASISSVLRGLSRRAKGFSFEYC